MRMRVDKAGAQSRITEIDHLRTLRDRDPATGIENLVSLHNDHAVRDQRLRFAVENPGGLERDHAV